MLIVDLNTQGIVATVDDAAATQLERTLQRASAELAHYFVDGNTVDALLEGVFVPIDSGFEAQLAAKLGACTLDELPAFVDATLPKLSRKRREALTEPEQRRVEEALAELLAGLDVSPRSLLAAVLASEPSELAPLPKAVRRDVVSRLLYACPCSKYRPARTRTRFDFNHLMNFAGTLFSVDRQIAPVSPSHGTLDERLEDAPISRPIVAALLRALVQSAAPEERQGLLGEPFDEWYAKRYFDAFREDFARQHQDALVQAKHLVALREYISAVGEATIAIVPEQLDHGLVVELRGGRELVKRDLFSSDPFCVLTLVDPNASLPQQARSETVPSTLRPVWNASFRFAASSRSTLRIAVFDEDKLSANDPMGSLAIDLQTLEPGEDHVLEQPLEGVESGTLELSLRLDPFEAVELVDDATPT